MLICPWAGLQPCNHLLQQTAPPPGKAQTVLCTRTQLPTSFLLRQRRLELRRSALAIGGLSPQPRSSPREALQVSQAQSLTW